LKPKNYTTKPISALFLCLLFVFVVNQAAAQLGPWETKAPMPTMRWSAAGGVISGKLYVAGGWNGTNSLATLEVYDPTTDTWTTKTPMPAARSDASGAVIDGKLYVVGGNNSAHNQKVTTLEVYDPVNDTWTTKTSMSSPRSNPGVVAMDGKLYVAGGCTGWCAPVTNVLEVYDPASNTWTTKASMPTGRGSTDVAAVNGLLYFMGGCCGSTSEQSALMAETNEAYNPVTNTWTAKAQHLVGAANTAGSINGKIYVAKADATEVYDPANDTWVSLTPMPTARQSAVGGIINGKFYVAGGYIPSPFAGVEVLEALPLSISASADYFPLSVGNTWVYFPSFGTNGNRMDTIPGEEFINDVRTYIWNRQEAPDDNYNEKRWLSKDHSGVKVHKIWSNEGIDPAAVIDPPWMMFESNPYVGDTFIGEVETSSGVFYTVTSYVESVNDTVTVPVGTFTNCIRIRMLDEMTQNSIKTAVGWRKEWYAPNIGCVIHAKYDADWGSATTTQQLIGFSVVRGLPGDANSDAKLGLDDAIYILQNVSGVRQ
jgi:N-acetylneuraminic acid mutarotase